MPALYAWLRRHPRLVDSALAVLLLLGGLAGGFARHHDGSLAVAFGIAVPVVFRRTHPAGAFAAAVTVGAAQVGFGVRPTLADFSIVVLLYSLTAYTSRRAALAGLAVCMTGSATAIARWRPHAISFLQWVLVGSILFAGPFLIAWVLGDSMRYRRAYYASLEQRAAQLERDREAQARIAAAAERARIARELHDVVAHNVSVMVVQADGAAYAMGTDPRRAREALAAISATGRQALAEMRALLGVLRTPDREIAHDGDRTPRDRVPHGHAPDRPRPEPDGPRPEPDEPRIGTADLAPQPGLAQLADLLDQTRTAGLPVTCSVEGKPAPLAAGVDLAAYRIIQESLTNARKHAGPLASIRVVLRYRGDAVDIAVTDDGLGGAASCDGAGHGLTGMRERAAMYGGSVTAGPRPGGGFVVMATLPRSAERAVA